MEEKLILRKGEVNYGSLKRSSFRGGIFKKYKFVLFDYLDEELFSKFFILIGDFKFIEGK